MVHNHSHSRPHHRLEKSLFVTMLLNFLITFVEVVGGILSGSLSLLSDAIHNFSDGIAMVVSYVAIRLSKRPRTLKYTFGLKRAELLAAIINASTLIVISFFLIKEAIGRFAHPTPITGTLMLVVAGVSLLANIIGTALVRPGSKQNINMRAAYFHLLSDVASSFAVIVGAVFIIAFNITWIDPALTIIISLYILKEGFEIVKESVDVILMSTPPETDITEIQRALEAIPGVKNIHHVHLWKMDETNIHFEAHIDVDDIPVSRTAGIRAEIELLLHNTFDVSHTTLQFECDSCQTKSLI
jgi:cobalt-zinc-cadmium efflux system protein